MKAPELLDLVLLAGEKQAVELLPLDADDEAGHQGGKESHQDAQRQVPAVCSEETNPSARSTEHCTKVSELRLKGLRVWLTAPSCGKEAWCKPCSSARRLSDQRMSCTGCWVESGQLQPPSANIFFLPQQM